jgi:TolB-like protein/DNA-binding winged helix-turn-helix (wHTH) protein/Tfp pilus assembly protein PilF
LKTLMTGSAEQPIYAFEGFHVDAQRRVLSRAGGDPIPLAPKVFDTLLYFVEHRGELLDKRALLGAVWPHVIVEENNLNQSISTLRRVLGERPGEHRYIVTEPGRGYRFVAAVRDVPAAQIADAVDTLPAVPLRPNPESTAQISAGASNRKWPVAVTALGVFALILVGIQRYVATDDAAQGSIPNGVLETSPEVDPARATNSIAVLPFVNLSSDAEQEYFSDGLSDELLSNLAQGTDLRVTARTSSFAFKGSDKSIQEIARALGVAHVLEGSVRRAGNRLRITAQLINASDGYQLWSQTYNPDLGDVFAIQQEIAASVAGSLSATLGVAPRGSGLGGTEVPEAYALYLAARAHYARGTRADNERCRDYLNQAIELDPDFASAWAYKAIAHSHAQSLFPERSEEEHEAAVRAAQRAIELEPNLGLAHGALGYEWSQQRELVRGEEEYRKALALGQPAHSLAAYSVLQLAVGNIDKARASFRAGREYDPLNQVIVAFLIGTHHLAGDTRAALAEYERGKVAYSNWVFGDFNAIVVRLSSGEVRSPTELPLDAGDIDRAAMEHFYEPERALQALRILYADERYADQIARRRLAVWAAYFGDPELALWAMKDSVTASTLNAFLLWFPLFSQVRQQPGFKNLMRDLGFVAYWRAYGWPKYCQPSGGDDFECS